MSTRDEIAQERYRCFAHGWHEAYGAHLPSWKYGLDEATKDEWRNDAGTDRILKALGEPLAWLEERIWEGEVQWTAYHEEEPTWPTPNHLLPGWSVRYTPLHALNTETHDVLPQEDA